MSKMQNIHGAFQLEFFEIFVQVADSGSIAKASELLLIDPSGISRKIKALETICGVTLFDRKSTGLFLNENGIEFYNFATHFLADFQTLTSNFQAQSIKLETYDSLSTSMFENYLKNNLQSVRLISKDIKKLITAFNDHTINLLIMDQEFSSALTSPVISHHLIDEPYYLVTTIPTDLNTKLDDFKLVLYPRTCPIHQKIIQNSHIIHAEKIIEIDFSSSILQFIDKDKATLLPECSIPSLNTDLFYVQKLPHIFDRHLTVFSKNQQLLDQFLEKIK